MELVSASKMRKAVNAAQAGRPYALYAWELLVQLSGGRHRNHPLLRMSQVKKIAVILITSDRGLCGRYKAQLIRKLLAQLRQPERLALARNGGSFSSHSSSFEKSDIDIITIGRKGEEAMKRLGFPIVASFVSLPDRPSMEDIRPIARIVREDYSIKKYDKIIVAYTTFVSAIRQIPKLRQLLPISKHDLEKLIAEIGEEGIEKKQDLQTHISADYIFEPKRIEIFNTILPRLVDVELYQMILEARASEEAARMVAMRNANEAAEEIVEDLTLEFNQIRQSAITQEIAEIAGCKAALED